MYQCYFEGYTYYYTQLYTRIVYLHNYFQVIKELQLVYENLVFFEGICRVVLQWYLQYKIQMHSLANQREFCVCSIIICLHIINGRILRFCKYYYKHCSHYNIVFY